MQDRDLASLSGLIRKQDRLAHIVGSGGVSDVHARRAEVAERTWRAVEPELLRQPQRAASDVERRLGPALEHLRRGHLGERCDQVPVGREWFQQCERLGGQLRPARIRDGEEHDTEHVHGTGLRL